MGSPLALRNDHDSSVLRRLARRSRHAGQSRRLLALAAIYDGASRGAAALLAGTDRQSIRDWVLRFNVDGPDGLVDRHGGGQKARLTPEMLVAALKARIEEGPRHLLIPENFHSSSCKHSETAMLRSSGFARISLDP